MTNCCLHIVVYLFLTHVLPCTAIGIAGTRPAARSRSCRAPCQPSRRAWLREARPACSGGSNRSRPLPD